MSRSVTLVLGGILVVIGLIWFFQGIGVLGGSAMSGVVLWAVIGPLVALAGAALILRGRRQKSE
jgi:drug/metabolite transporter superfamily protein YnfA